MTRDEAETLISRIFDGEAIEPDSERALRDYLGAHPDARDLETSWKAIGDRIRAEAHRVTPDVDAAWDSILDAIEAGERGDEPAAAPKSERTVIAFPAIWKAAAGIAAVILVALGLFEVMPNGDGGRPANGGLETDWAEVEFIKTDIEGGTPVVYQDRESGWTVVWVIEPEQG